MPRFAQQFTVHSYEVDAFQSLALPTLAGYLQEIAGQHAATLGCGLDELLRRGLTWVLVRQRIDVLAPLRLADELVVTTWPSGTDRLVATREFSVARGEGGEVARATTHWLVLDLATQRPVRPDQVLDLGLRPRLDPVAPVPARLPVPAADAPGRAFDVRYSDIDQNLHANNTSYLSWALECVPEDFWRASRPRSVEAHYLAQCRYGERVAGRIEAEEGGFHHGLARADDGRELARLRTRWVAR